MTSPKPFIPSELLSALPTPGGGGRGGRSDPMGPPVKPDRSVQISPPWQYPTPGAQDVFKVLDANVSVAAGVVTEPTGLVFTVPAGYDGVITFVGYYVDLPDTLLRMKWAFQINGSPRSGFDNIRSYPRAASNLSEDFPGTIRVFQNDRLSIIITNEGTTTYSVNARFGGFIWPREEGERLTGLKAGEY